MAEADAFQALDSLEPLERAGVLRADPVDQNLMQLADVARARYRKGQDVPERKAQIIDQHFAARVRVPFGRLERGQQIVELARARVETDLESQSLDQTIDLMSVLFHERIGIGIEMLDLTGGGRSRENVGHQVADLATVEAGILPAPKRIEATVECPLEPVDHERIEADEAILTDQLIKPVLPLDQKVQAPLAVFDVESQQVFYPSREVFLGLRIELERFAVGALVDNALAHGPGIDDFGHHARQRGLRRHAPQL